VQGDKVDGLVMNRVRLDDWRLHYLAEEGILHVTLALIDFVGVEVDSYNGFLKLMANLVNQGYSQIAYIDGDPNLKIDQDYQAGLKAMQIAPEPVLIARADLTSEGGYQAEEYQLKHANPPTAIVCVNDLEAFGANHATNQCGYKIGRDIAIAGFD